MANPIPYRSLTLEQRRETYERYVQEMGEQNVYGSFEEYDDDQMHLNWDFDADTLEFLS